MENLPLEHMFKQAQAAHGRGELAQALSIYTQVLQTDPCHFDALHLSGVVAAQSGDLPRAAALISAAIKLSSHSSESFFNRARVYEGLGQPDAALQDYRVAVSLNPSNPQAWLALGHLLVRLQMWSEALHSFEQAVGLDKNNPAGHYMAGSVQSRLGHLQAARQSFLRAIHINPRHTDACCSLGGVLKALGCYEQALLSYNTAFELDPTHTASYFGCADTLHLLKRLEDAVCCYDRLIARHPDSAGAFNNRGIVLQELKQWDSSVASFTAAIALDATYAEAYYNRANTYIKKAVSLDLMQLAAEDYRCALAIKPDYPDALNNLGSVYKDLHQFDAARQCFDLCLQQQPDNADAHWNKALNCLVTGALNEGWEEFEWRWKLNNFSSPARNFSQPVWSGQESLVGKTLLLHAEQGLGDTLQFCRYADWAAKLGAKVVLQVQRPLVRLLGALSGVSAVVALGDTLPNFDLHCPLLSLPLAFKTSLDSIPATVPYLFADTGLAAQWQQVLGPRTQPRVGLVWSGSQIHKNDHNRSLFLQDLLPHLPQNYQYFSLQKELRSHDVHVLQMHPNIVHRGDQLADFSDTAALCAQMDAVISVDTSVAHLAAAMGKPVWVLLPYSPDWRWLTKRTDSPWYPSVRLLRAEQPGGWSGALHRLHDELVLK